MTDRLGLKLARTPTDLGEALAGAGVRAASHPAHLTTHYRRDIQILRGLAVILVVLFHFGVPGFSSGFLGVDIFFVISGYLMALLYDPARKPEFLLRRARRILPSYFAVILATLITATFVVVPSDFEQVSSHSIWATLLVPNIGFWAENSYFDKAAFKPLLHLWSLGVEIQFYVLIPLIVWLGNKARFGLLLLTAGSALCCFVVVGVSPKTAFFWLPFRLWEFLAGFGLAKWSPSPRREGVGCWVGLTALPIMTALSLIPVNGQALGFVHGHPGLPAFLTVCLTAVVIGFGLPRRVETSVPLTAAEKIGDHSYSIYLVHFPIIVLFLYKPFSGTISHPTTLGQFLALLALITAATVVLHVFIEKPGRRLGKKALLYQAGASVLLVAGVGQITRPVLRLVLPHQDMLIYEAMHDRAVYRCGKLYRLVHPTGLTCEITNPISDPSHRILLVGNSHADAIRTTFASIAQKRNVSVYFMVPNDPMMRGSSITPERVVKEAKTRKADAIVLDYSPGALEPGTLGHLAELAGNAGIRVDFLMPVPVWNFPIPAALIRHIKSGETLPSQTLTDYLQANRALAQQLTQMKDVTVYDTAPTFCRPECILTSSEGRPLYFDTDHLTLTGSTMLQGVFDTLIADLG